MAGVVSTTFSGIYWILRPVIFWTMCGLGRFRAFFGRLFGGSTTTSNDGAQAPLIDPIGETLAEAKERFRTMPKEEKRKHYKCGKDYNKLDDVPTWPEYYAKHKDRLKKLAAEVKLTTDIKPDPELNKLVSIWKGDITTLEIDAIVNAANGSLLGGGGVDGAIHKAAGSQLVQECRGLKGCDTGDAKITLGYKLPAKHVIHTVGPIGEKPADLISCYSKSLELVKNDNLQSVAFPCISTGIFGYPNKDAAFKAIETARDWLVKDRPQGFSRLIFCLFMPQDVKLYEILMQKYFPIEESKPAPAAKLSEGEEQAEEKTEQAEQAAAAAGGEHKDKKRKQSTDSEDSTEGDEMDDKEDAALVQAAVDSEQVEAGEGQVEAGGGQVEAGGEQVEAGGEQVEAGGEQVEAGGEQVEAGGDQPATEDKKVEAAEPDSSKNSAEDDKMGDADDEDLLKAAEEAENEKTKKSETNGQAAENDSPQSKQEKVSEEASTEK